MATERGTQFWEMFGPVCLLSMSMDRCREIGRAYFQALSDLDFGKLREVLLAYVNDDGFNLQERLPTVKEIRQRYYQYVKSLNQKQEETYFTSSITVREETKEQIDLRIKARVDFMNTCIEVNNRLGNDSCEQYGVSNIAACFGLMVRGELKDMGIKVNRR